MSEAGTGQVLVRVTMSGERVSRGGPMIFEGPVRFTDEGRSTHGAQRSTHAECHDERSQIARSRAPS